MSNCKLFHDWGRWKTISATVNKITYLGEKVTTEANIQKRTCKRCGKEEVNYG